MELAVNARDVSESQAKRQGQILCLRSLVLCIGTLKPQNILVTKWDATTDTPTIKLADFGLAGIGSEHQTLCGTEGYIAPEIIQADERAKVLQTQRDRWMKTIVPNRLPTYTNAVDIWALGKILQEFLQDVSSHASLLRGKRVSINKKPALRLIDRMM
ncbi:MAG: hypothetical protein LQ347_002554 [Umbilicaria vellea]|nr:MAG: hypothetical protein LQ347_002554 [Umbilicaria vellea]